MQIRSALYNCSGTHTAACTLEDYVDAARSRRTPFDCSKLCLHKWLRHFFALCHFVWHLGDEFSQAAVIIFTLLPVDMENWLESSTVWRMRMLSRKMQHGTYVLLGQLQPCWHALPLFLPDHDYNVQHISSRKIALDQDASYIATCMRMLF